MHHNTIPFLLVQFRLMTSVLFRYIAKSEIWIDTLRSKPTSYLKITSAKDLSNYLVSQPDNNETMIRHFLCSHLPSRIIRSQTFLITLANLGGSLKTNKQMEILTTTKSLMKTKNENDEDFFFQYW